MSEIEAGPSLAEVEKFFTAAPERIWRMLTAPELMARWLLEPTGFEPIVGTRFTFRTDEPGRLGGHLAVTRRGDGYPGYVATQWFRSR